MTNQFKWQMTFNGKSTGHVFYIKKDARIKQDELNKIFGFGYRLDKL